MPEGHTIHRIARDHHRHLSGQQLTVLSPQGRFAEGASRLSGQSLNSVEAYGKHLCYHWASGDLLHIHLGLYGKFRWHGSSLPDPKGQVRLRVVGRGQAFDLNGPNCCEILDKEHWLQLTSRLGQDPLREDANPELVWRRITRSRAAIGSLLLNQSVIAGVGNIYRSEVLYLLKIHPDMPARDLAREQFDSLWNELKRLLRIGVRYNRIIVADPKELGRPRSKMRREERLLIYKKLRCARCSNVVQTWDLAARKVFACPQCQRLP